MQPQTAPSAVGALIGGIAGLVLTFLCGILGLVGIVGIVLGNKAKREIEESGGLYGGSGMASAGQICGWIAVGLLALGIVVVLVIMIVAALAA